MSKRGNFDSYTTYTSSGIPPADGSTDDCGNLSFPAELKSPQQPALSKAQEGDVFKIQLNAARIPWVLNNDGEPCGIVVSLQSQSLVDCLSKGKLFSAAILKIDGDACSVLVQPAKQ
ncbi:hypothetical protein [Hymenobacter sp. B1770]|uniref:hypothetical protein n=1 Tax=Hymenobacter sp. B1770 TaxID=1718788 RepID=UPI003CEC5459